jgi:glycosyltransferase involved in cell wall biosynthesis
MHIAFVNSLYPPHGAAGAETSLRLLATSLRDRGHRCSVVTLTPEPAGTNGEVDGIAVRALPLANVYWPFGGRRPRLLRPVFQAFDAHNPAMGRRLAGVLAELRPDVVHMHNLQGFSVAAWGAAEACGVPVVQTLHDYYTACPRSTMWRPGRGNCATPCAECALFAAPRRRLSRVPHVVTSVSRRVIDRVHAAGVFATTRHVRVIRGNNAPQPDADASRRDGPLRLGFLGRLDPAKGIGELIEAVAGLPITLQVAGSGAPDYEAALRTRAAGANVNFLGHVAPTAFLRGLDLLVIPSVWEDPFPRVFHEALAQGVPSLVTPLGGLPEVIVPGVSGFVAREAGAAGLREALLDLPPRARWPDRAALREAARDYDAGRIASQYEAVLVAAAQRGAPPDDAGESWSPPSA